MRRDTKFNYGFFLVSLGVPLVADYFVGRKCAVILAIVVTGLGVLLLLAGHQHRDNKEQPIIGNRWRKALVFGSISAVLGAAAIGVGAVLKHKDGEVAAIGQPSKPSSSVQENSGATGVVRVEVQPPPKHTAAARLKDKQTPTNDNASLHDNSVHLENGSKIEQQSSGDCSPNIVGGNPTVNCGPPPIQLHLAKVVDVVPPVKDDEGHTPSEFVYEKEVTVTVSGRYTPVSVAVVCSSRIADARAFLRYSTAAYDLREGIAADGKTAFVYFEGSPATPEQPLIFHIWANAPFSVLSAGKAAIH